MTEKQLNILFINNNYALIPNFHSICAEIIKNGHEVHVMYKNHNTNNEDINELKNIPYIYLQEIPVLKQKLLSNINLLWNIRQYLQKHDDINTISCVSIDNILSNYLIKKIFKKPLINLINLSELKKFSKRSLHNNILTTSKTGKCILFVSSYEKKQVSAHPSFQNIKLDSITTSLKPENIAGKLISLFQIKD